jgi:HSP20 family protein
MNIKRKWLALALVITAGTGIVAGIANAEAPRNNDQNTGFTGKLKAWQEEMSQTFRDTWDRLWKDNEKAGHLLGNASVDLREQENDYVIRASMPGRTLDKVEVSLEGDTLKIEAPAEGKLGSYRQAITLAGVKPDAKPGIARQPGQNVVVITVPKAAGDAKNESTAGGIAPFPPLTDWEHDVFRRMERMQREMDRIFEHGFDEFRFQPLHKGFFDRARFGSAFDIREEGENYVIRAWLPGRDSRNVNVDVNLSDRTLKIEARAEGSPAEDAKDTNHTTRKAWYSQMVTLPGPVESSKMKVERKDGMLLITVPKAKED